MLLVPSTMQIGDTTIFPDSDLDYQFYYLPNAPTLRRGADGKPSFLFLKYREDASTMGEGGARGGGYVQFDAELSLTAAARAEVERQLQEIVNKRYRDRGDQRPPKVQLALPQWVDDAATSVELITMQARPDGSGMITQIAGSGGKPSLVGNNVATFGIDLTQRGAALLREACQAATLPIGVRYNISFLARFPSLQMRIWLYANQFHSYSEQIKQDIDEGVWSDDNESYTRTISETFSKYQVGGVDIVSWPTNLGGGGSSADAQSLQKEMQQWGWGLIQDTLRDSMKDRFSAVTDANAGGQGDFKEVFRNYSQSFSENLDIMITAEQVRTWPVHPQASLRGPLTQPDAQGQVPARSELFREVSLDDPFFRLLQVRMRCNADFTNDPIFAVKVHIEYGQRANEYIFQDTGTVQLFQEFVDPALGRKYSYWYEVSYKNSDRRFKSGTMTSNETQLVIDVKEFGYLKFDIVAGAFDWNIVDAAQVHIRYSDPANQVPLAEETLQLTKDARQQTYQRLIWAPVDQPYEYQVVYFLKNGQQVSREWTRDSTSHLILNDIFEDQLLVRLLPTGGFARLSKILVDFEYQDQAHAYSAQETYTITADTEQDAHLWFVPLWKGAPQNFRYRTILIYKDGRTAQSDWQPALGSQTLTVGEVFADYLTVNILPDLLDFATVRLVKVSLRYSDPANQIEAQEDFVFTKDKKAAATWKLPIKDQAQKGYRYSIVYFLADGTQRSIPDTAATDNTIVLDVPAAAAAPPG